MQSSSLSAPSGPLASAHPSILVVEDEFLVRLIICDELRAAEYNVIEAVNGDEAVAILKSGARVDLIFSDVRMPGAIDGLGLLAFVRQAYPTTPVIITSGHLRPDLALADGATQFLSKPYSIEHAIRLVESGLEKWQ
jgi:CheY-like chemotaxis protein